MKKSKVVLKTSLDNKVVTNAVSIPRKLTRSLAYLLLEKAFFLNLPDAVFYKRLSGSCPKRFTRERETQTN